MGAVQRVVHFRSDSENLSLRILTDPAERVETPAFARPRISVHLGPSVYMVCQRAGRKHAGWAVHGDIEVIPAGLRSAWEPRQPDTALIVAVKPELLTSAALELGFESENLELLNRFQTRDTQIEHICWALKAEMEAGYPTGRVFLDSLGTALAEALVRRHSSAATNAIPERKALTGHKLRRILSYIEDNLSADLSLNEIAQCAGLSVSHLKTTFRQSAGLPVHAFIIQRRLERAKTLLHQGVLPISQIAREVGFAHQSHLATNMRRYWGCTPKAFRTVARRGLEDE